MAMKPGYRILTAFSFSFIISLIIYMINFLVLGNAPNDMSIIIISLVIFIDIFLGFVCYWLIRNLFSKRWVGIDSSAVKSRIFRIPVGSIHLGKLRAEERESLYAYLNKDQADVSMPFYGPNTSLFAEIVFPDGFDNRTLVFYCHGFNDNSQKIRYKTYALAKLGYTVLVWDARGMGSSSKAGKKSDFVLRNLDTAAIIQFYLQNPHYQEYRFAIIGESMGGISAVYAMELLRERIDKCILISTPSIFNETFPRNLFPFSRKWIQRFNYIVKGIDPYPQGETNEQISPYLLIKKMKDSQTESQWSEFTNSRFLLIHSKTDYLIEVEKSEQNARVLNLKAQNVLLFETGNHNQIKNELGILSAVHEFLSK